MCEKINKVRSGGSGTQLISMWLFFAITDWLFYFFVGQLLAQLSVWRSAGTSFRGQHEDSGYIIPHSWVQWSPVSWHNFTDRGPQAKKLRIWSRRWEGCIYLASLSLESQLISDLYHSGAHLRDVLLHGVGLSHTSLSKPTSDYLSALVDTAMVLGIRDTSLSRCLLVTLLCPFFLSHFSCWFCSSSICIVQLHASSQLPYKWMLGSGEVQQETWEGPQGPQEATWYYSGAEGQPRRVRKIIFTNHLTSCYCQTQPLVLWSWFIFFIKFFNL